jgi:hypothetical protein
MTKKLESIPDYLRKEISVYTNLDYGDFDGNIDDIIERLQKYKDDGAISINIEKDYESLSFYLIKKRLETDKEYWARIKREERDRVVKEKYKKVQEKERKKLYLELKKEFGDE